jgi:hypothetical protein
MAFLEYATAVWSGDVRRAQPLMTLETGPGQINSAPVPFAFLQFRFCFGSTHT